ncbi:stage II sporulation protein P [Oikeobacillus pervagus]|uniref:Stage II sporulation protein P n=1 Tax=Oikeobacillus pervagus TaxID=1325931 RepID=A0AAJ1T0X4_9BACI|nr:stage II sporulation protein P [Oikeobacillus pervagus]MDQ0213939.1 stage II sporulation protein P [Oikeobacillus pervagus]
MKHQPHYILAINFSTIIKGAVLFIIALLSVFSMVGLLTTLKYDYRLSSHSIHRATQNVTGEALFQLYKLENKTFSGVEMEDVSMPNLSEMLFQFSTNVRFQDPRSLLGRELPGFSIFDGKILVAGEGTNYTNMPIESEPSMDLLDSKNESDSITLQDNQQDKEKQPPLLSTKGKKKVFLYFTHNRESYLPLLKGVTDPDAAHHSVMNVTKVGEVVQGELESKGIGTVIDPTDIAENLSKKGLKYGASYNESREVVSSAMTNNRDLQYFFDIHRDSQRKAVTTAKINGKEYAKVAFVVGGEHPNYEKNAHLATELHKMLEKKYKGISRGVILKQGSNTNGKFNQDLSQNALLIEFGGVDNTYEELKRTAEAFSDIFAEHYWQALESGRPDSTPRKSQ